MSTEPTKYRHVMIDIETMSSATEAAIMTIGAVPFMLNKSRMELAPEYMWFHRGTSLAANKQAGRDISPDTIEWWMSQSNEAQKGLLEAPRDHNLRKLLVQFDSWTKGFAPIPGEGEELVGITDDYPFKFENVWAKPPEFDLSILRHAYEQEGFQCPWHYRATRDVRTELARAKFLGREDILGLAFEGEPHNAAHDAAHQARQVILSYGGTSQ